MPDTYSKTFAGAVQGYELSQVAERRSRVHSPQHKDGEHKGEPKVTPTEWDMPKADPLRADLVGVAFSGGGIRSATFNLGVLQALGRLKLLTRVDYLSTVSGGGYIGGWLAAWIRRVGEPGPSRPSRPTWTSVEAVESHLDPRTERLKVNDPTAAEPEPETIHHLRAHSRYLAPRFGLFTLDAWALLAIYARNLLITWLIVAPMLLVVALFCRWVVAGFAAWPAADLAGARSPDLQTILAWLFWVFLAGLASAEAVIRGLFGRVFAAGEAARAQTPKTGGEAGRPPELAESGHLEGPPSLSTRVVRSQTFWAAGAVALLAVATLGVWLEGPAPGSWGGPSGTASRMPDEYRVPRPMDEFAAVLGGPPVAALGARSPADPGEGGARPGRVLSEFLAIPGEYFGDDIRGATLFAALGLLGGVVGALLAKDQTLSRRLLYLGLTVLFGAVFGVLFTLLINHVLFFDGRNHPALFATIGTPLFLLALVAAGFIETMFAGRVYREYEREWRARLAGWLMLCAAGWLLVFGTVVYLPWALELLDRWAFGPEGRKVIPWGTFAGWVATTLFGLFAARRTAAGVAGPSLRTVARVVPVVFLAGLLAIAGELSLRVVGPEPQEPPPAAADRGPKVAVAADRDPLRVAVAVDYGDAGDRPQPRSYLHLVEDRGASPWRLLAWAWFFFGLFVAAVALVPATRFSLHSLYMNRLTRAYLGASLKDPKDGRGAAGLSSKGKRKANNFTGFDPHDDLPLAALRVKAGDLPAEWKKKGPYLGPYPIFNTTLNLVAGEELAYQDRKGASFALTPAYCGSDPTGYAMLDQGDADALWNLTVGRAVTISGAAVDPNMQNYHSPQLTAFLTILNARLGWWIEKPTGGGWSAGPPGFPGAGWPYLRELGGQTDTSWGYVHLSDGGHFENTGAYELIRRRCRHVVVVDAAEDSADASENLANLIRLVRTDFGIPIDIDTTPIRKDARGISRWHCAVGAIRYDEVDTSGVTGTLLFIRPSLTGDEEADLKNYAATNPPFPHHSTADQFFEEAQFESYRQLGFHVGMEVFRGARQEVGEPEEVRSDAAYRAYTRRLFAALRRAWAPLPDGFSEPYLRSCRDYLEATGDLRDHEPPAGGSGRGLRRVSQSLFAEARNLPAPFRRANAGFPPGVDTDAYYTDLHEVDSLLQVMELAWLENDLERFGAHPLNRGWMNVFRRWTASGAFHRYWPALRGQYSRGFVRFCEVALNLAPLPVQWCRITDPDAEPWKHILTDLGLEFRHEWAESLLDEFRRDAEREITDPVRLRAHVRDYHENYQRQYVRRAVRHSRQGGGVSLAWVVTTGRGGELSGSISRDEWVKPPDAADGVLRYDPEHAEMPTPSPSGQGPTAGRSTGRQSPEAHLPLGLVVAFPPGAVKGTPLAGATVWELLVWIRGPYRTMGLGRACLPWLLDNESGDPSAPAGQQRGIIRELRERGVTELVVRYPQLSGTAGDRLQRTMWTWFFNDHDFVSHPKDRDPRDEDPPVIRLVRDLRQSGAQLTHRARADRHQTEAAPHEDRGPGAGGAGQGQAGGGRGGDGPGEGDR